MSAVAILCVSIVAGVIGAIMGVGGGIVVVPALSTFFGVDVKEAIATSAVCVIATSVAGASRYVKQGLANIRLGLFLNVTSVAGSVVGALVTSYAPKAFLYLAMGVVLTYLSISQMLTSGREQRRISEDSFARAGEDRVAARLGLSSEYYDEASRVRVRYRVVNMIPGLLVSFLAGVASGLLGIGGGVLTTPLMNQLMNVPIKASVATSKFMIGTTAVGGAMIYYIKGAANVVLAVPVAIGLIIGANIGAWTMNKIKVYMLKMLFGALVMYLAYSMFARFLFLATGMQLPGVRL